MLILLVCYSKREVIDWFYTELEIMVCFFGFSGQFRSIICLLSVCYLFCDHWVYYGFLINLCKQINCFTLSCFYLLNNAPKTTFSITENNINWVFLVLKDRFNLCINGLPVFEYDNRWRLVQGRPVGVRSNSLIQACKSIWLAQKKKFCATIQNVGSENIS